MLISRTRHVGGLLGDTSNPVRIIGARRVEVESVIPDEQTRAIVASFEALVTKKMDGVVGASAAPLDARFKTIRSAE